MGDFSKFYKELELLITKFGDVKLKVETDLDSDTVKIFGERLTSLSRAKNGLSDVAELSLATAEHHPYWNLLSQCYQICSAVLDKWDDDLTADEIDEIRWSVLQLDAACKKLETKITGKDK